MEKPNYSRTSKANKKEKSKNSGRCGKSNVAL
jgi:hypothetical protein